MYTLYFPCYVHCLASSWTERTLLVTVPTPGRGVISMLVDIDN